MLLQVYLQSQLTPINLFARWDFKKTFSTAQAQRESDLGISMKCVNSMSDDIVAFEVAFSLDRGPARAMSAFQ